MKSSMNTRHYDYSPTHRIVEIFGIALCLAMLGELLWRLTRPLLNQPGLVDWTWLASGALAGYIAADLVSGVVHWLADRFGTPQTPIVGQAFVHPFREHHDFPKKILEHDFIEVNGNNCLVMLLYLTPLLLVLPAHPEGAWMGLASFSFFFACGIFMTNQFHQWAHADEVSPLVAWLQRHNLVLSPAAHDRHHTAPYETDYCITSGWMNPLLERLQVFARIERALGRDSTRSPAASREAGEPLRG
jgi:ubiquitin-conjugating enzyme E2 variant